MFAISHASPTVARIDIEHVEAGGGAGRHADQLRGGAGELPEFADPVGIGAGVLEAVAALGFGDAGALLRSAREHRQAGWRPGRARCRARPDSSSSSRSTGSGWGRVDLRGARAIGRSGSGSGGGAPGVMYALTVFLPVRRPGPATRSGTRRAVPR